jgi:hypothetical protein
LLACTIKRQTDRRRERKKGRQTEINRNSQTQTERERMGDRQSRRVSGQTGTEEDRIGEPKYGNSKGIRHTDPSVMFVILPMFFDKNAR